MSEDAETMGLIWKGLLGLMGVAGMIIAFFTRRVIADVDDLKKNDADCRLDLANFKTEVANNYAKDVTMQGSLGRIHDRIDELGGDIKTILATMKR